MHNQRNTLDSSNQRNSGAIEKVSAYAWYVAIIFAIFFVFSFVDRQIIGVLVKPMKAELMLSDLQLSYIGGLSFVIFYSIFGIPLGRLADSYNRKWLIIFGVIIWSTATALCGLTTGYWQLLLLRMGVGLGEAALAPCAYSMLADMFPRQRLAMAISICTMGGAFGYGFAFLGGALILGWSNNLVGEPGFIEFGMLGQLTPWRIVFLAVGVPCLIFTLSMFTIKEPVRQTRGGSASSSIPISDVLAYFRTHIRAFVFLYVGMGCLNIGSYGAAFWDITFFDRTYGWPPEQSGIFYGIAATLCQFTGALIGGLVADRLSVTGTKDAKILVLVIIAFASLWLRLIYPFMPSSTSAMAAIIPLLLLTGAPFGVAAAALQIMAPARMRGQVTAAYFFVQALIGLGIGPTLVAFLTEQVFQDLSMLRYSLVISGGVGLSLASLLFFYALKPYQEALVHAEQWDRDSC